MPPSVTVSFACSKSPQRATEPRLAGEGGLPDRSVVPAGFRERRSLVAIVTNHESQRVINRFGVPNGKRYAQGNIRRMVDVLKTGARLRTGQASDQRAAMYCL